MNLIGVFFKGFAMGAANVIPGVSGGTIAFVFGIYERLIDAIKSLDVAAVKMILRGKFGEFVKHVDFWFLAALGAGVVASVLTLAKLLEIGFERYPVYVAALFFGLIAASVWSVGKMVKVWSVGVVVGLLIGCGVAVAMVFAPEAEESRNLFYLLVCGVVAMCSMIVPGVSGSFVLLLMGNYQLIMISSVNKLREGLKEMDWGKLGEAFGVLVPVGIGAVVGLIALSHLLSWLFKRFHDVAVAVITGFVAGSLVIIWPWKRAIVEVFGEKEKIVGYERYMPSVDGAFWAVFGVMLVGVVLMIGVEKAGATKDKIEGS